MVSYRFEPDAVGESCQSEPDAVKTPHQSEPDAIKHISRSNVGQSEVATRLGRPDQLKKPGTPVACTKGHPPQAD